MFHKPVVVTTQQQKLNVHLKQHLSIKNNYLKFTSTTLEHNHQISKEIYNSYSQVTTRKIKTNPNATYLQEKLAKAWH